MGIKMNQTAARIIMKTGINFNNVNITTYKIGYEKPDGKTNGLWTATPLGSGLLVGKIYVDFNDSIKFDMLGIWRLWTYLVFSDSRVAQGDVTTYQVLSEEVIIP